jgi:hypothetical protein
MTKEALSFNPREVASNLLTDLPPRAKQVLKKRFGLDTKETMTLEAVGQIYGITRERVRQIEEAALKSVRKSPAFGETAACFEELRLVMEAYGGVVHESEFLNYLAEDKITQHCIHFLLVIGDAFSKLREDDAFYRRWTVNPSVAEAVHESLRNLCERLSPDDLLPEDHLIKVFCENLHETLPATTPPAQLKNWIKLSKEIDKSPVGEWGLAKSPNVHVRGIRDYAYLVLRQAGEPLHFTEVAKRITKDFNKPTNAATSHNELIKDSRFVLVGRGIYALSEWGYKPGVVREVIDRLLKKSGPLTEADILKRVLKERLVKPNTVLVNLRNPKFFKKNKDGKYTA